MQLLRKLSRNWQWTLINILGLSLALACVALVFVFTKQELTYDQFHSKADRIYRITTSTAPGGSVMHPARVWGQWVPQFPQEYAEIESFVRLVPFKKGVVAIENQSFYSDNMYRVDSTIFDVFDVEWLRGDQSSALNEPREAVITRSMAEKYFGSIDVVGKTISLMHQQHDTATMHTVVGVMEDLPVNSHFHVDVLATIPDMNFNNSWGYTYYLLREGTDVEVLRQSIQDNWDKNVEPNVHPTTFHFQKLTDIHLYSHKTREMEVNGDVRSVILLASGAFIILFIALINFLNLSRVQFIFESKNIQIRMINGASKTIVARSYAVESLVIGLSAIALGIIMAVKLGAYLRVDLMSYPLSVGFICLLFLAVIVLLSIYPLYTSKVTSNTKVSSSKARMYTFPLVLQFTLAVVAIAGTIVLNRQINYLSNEHPNAENANILVIERNPFTVIHRYETLKERLISNPAIVSMTGAMEEPGGDILDNGFFELEGHDPASGQVIYIFTIDANFFQAMGIEPLAGTVDLGTIPSQEWEKKALDIGFQRMSGQVSQAEIDAQVEELDFYRDKYILNEPAMKMLGVTDPQELIGKRFRYKFQFPELFPEGEIVGVVPTFHYTNLHHEERPMVIAAKQVFCGNFLIEIDPERRQEALAHINETWQEINPEYPLEYEYISDSYSKVYTTEYAETRVLSLFAFISILLSALGIYAIAAFTINRRMKEIGIRKVNGASISEIMTMLNRSFVLWIALAFVIATPIAWYAMHRWLENFAYKIDLSWWIFALAGLISMAVAMATVSFQSYRAATRNPVDTIRYE